MTQMAPVARDAEFFERVLTAPALVSALEANGFTETRIDPQPSNDVLVITKRDWYLPDSDPNVKQVNVHFESRRRGDVRLDIELYPDRQGLADNPELADTINALWGIKTALHREVRRALTSTRGPTGEPLAHENDSYGPDNRKACTAVTFDESLDDTCKSDEHASTLAHVLEVATPIVDRILKNFRRG